MKGKEREIGDPVHIRNAPDIEGTVTAILHRVGGYIEYEVTWVVNGEIKVAWLTPLLLATEKESKMVGFSEQPK